MKRLTQWLSLTALLLALGPAQAEPPQGRGEVRPRPDAPQGERRDEGRRDDGRRDEQGNRPPKLSPEERRELRQQIHEAGHDVYHRPKRQQQ